MSSMPHVVSHRRTFLFSFVLVIFSSHSSVSQIILIIVAILNDFAAQSCSFTVLTGIAAQSSVDEPWCPIGWTEFGGDFCYNLEWFPYVDLL